MSSSPDGKEYLGIAYNKVTPVMSNNPEDYQWARITGEGIPGNPERTGKTYYTWVRYADDARGNGMSDSPNGKYYIGFAYNKEVPTESRIPQIISGRSIKGMMVRTVLESNLLQSTTSHPKRVPESQYPLLGGALRSRT